MDPATLATVATIAGAGISAVGAIQQGQQAAAAARTQGQVLQQQAAAERGDTAAEEADFRRQQQRLMGTRRALLGATGVESGTGSPLATSADFAAETELQALRIRSGGERRATRLEQEASLVRQRGTQARRAGFVRGGALLLSGVGATDFG